MVQLLFGLGMDTSSESWIMNGIRLIFASLDGVVYSLLSYAYEVLFHIADSAIIQSSTIKIFYGRIQLIIGVFMIFKLAVSLLQYVVNPDTFSDQKKGFSQIITRIILMLAMFAAIRPLNIPNPTPGSYNAYLNQHGLLFGTLYSLQSRILKKGTIPKLILGYKNPSSGDTDAGNGDNTGNAMANFLLRLFISVNVKDINKPISDNEDNGNYAVPRNKLDSKYKYADGTDVYDVYSNSEASAWDLVGIINATDGKHYAFAYFPIVSTICGAIIFIIIAAFCIDVATRAIKIAILRLIAPIPIISYIDPKSSENNGSFSTWVKMLTTTYLNLFIILAVVHFAFFLIEQVIPKGSDFANGGGLAVLLGGAPALIAYGVGGVASQIAISYSSNILVNVFIIIFIIIGILFFAKQAPKFIMDALGIKSMGLGVGLSGLLGATGSLMGGAGLRGALAGGLTAMNNASEAAATGKQAPSAFSTGSDLAAKIRTGDPNAKGGITQTLQRSALNALANRNGFEQAVQDKKYFGDESEAARQHINQLNRDIAAEQGNLASLKTQQESNNLNIENTKDALKNNFSENMRDRINELRRQGYDNNAIRSEMTSYRGVGSGAPQYATQDLDEYFATEAALETYQSQATTLQGDISASEATIATYQSELRETEVYKGEMDYNKGKAQEGIDKMYKIYGNVGNASQNDDSRYSARTRTGPPWGP